MNNLKTVRKSDPRKLTQKDVADFLGADRSTYAKYETGDSEPNFDTLSRLADFFGVSIEYLMGRTNIKNPTDRPTVDDDDIKFALFGTTDIDDATLEDIKAYARFKRDQRKR